MGRWLTPPKAPVHKYYNRQVTIPAGADFCSIFNGLVTDLMFSENWEAYGDLTPDEAAAQFTALAEQFLTAQNEPPFAEDPDELGGENKQPWYEDLADWVISGFLAVTFTYQAAIVYQTVIPKLRLAIRTGNIGGAFTGLLNH